MKSDPLRQIHIELQNKDIIAYKSFLREWLEQKPMITPRNYLVMVDSLDGHVYLLQKKDAEEVLGFDYQENFKIDSNAFLQDVLLNPSLERVEIYKGVPISKLVQTSIPAPIQLLQEGKLLNENYGIYRNTPKHFHK